MAGRTAKRKSDVADPLPPNPPRPKREKRAPAQEPTPESTITTTKTENEASRRVLWLSNPRWTDRLVAFIIENPNIRLKLFGDSTKVAASEDRPKADSVPAAHVSFCRCFSEYSERQNCVSDWWNMLLLFV
jgi:hypothetical protein